ncbi:Transcriptional Coactivator p15 (PC4), partial [Halocaridina rubra]
MPRNRKDESDSSTSDSDSGPEREEPPQKKAKSGGSGAVAKKDSSGDTYFDLEGLKRVTVREFKGKIYVDIREYYEKDGKVLPGKK